MVNDPAATLRGVDLNHLRALYVLLDEANVGRAAARLHITPPAASNALRRLRDLLGDQLLVRSGSSMVRTPAGEALRVPAAEFVAAAEALLRPAEPFSPAAWRGRFSLLTSDYAYISLAASLERALEERAPGIELTVGHVVADGATWLRTHDGLLISPEPPTDADIEAERLLCDRFVLVLRTGHPLCNKRVTLKRYCELRHVQVTPRGRPGGPVDDLLHGLGRARNIVRMVATHFLAAYCVAESDCVTLLPERFVKELGARLGLVARPIPFEFPGFEFNVAWHRRHNASPVHVFMRQLLHEASGT